MVLFVPVLCVAVVFLVTVLYTRGTFRFLYLVSKIQGPTLLTFATVHFPKLLADMINHLCDMCRMYSYEPWGFWTMNGDYVVVVSSVEAMAAVYKSKNLSTKPGFFYKRIANYIGEGSLLLSGGEKWRNHRKVVSPVFHKSVLDQNIDVVNIGAENIVNELAKKADGLECDLTGIFEYELADTAFSFLTSGRVIVDVRAYLELLSKMLYFAQIQTFNPLKYWFEMTFCKSSKVAEERVRRMFADIRTEFSERSVEANEQMNNRENKEPRDVLECCLKNFYKVGTFSKEDMFNEFSTVVSAGIETTKTGTKLAILLLSLHPEAQERAREELDSIFGSDDQRTTPEDLNKMKYVEAIVKETLRLFPPAPLIARKATDETEINGTIIPKDAFVLLNIMALQRNPDSFKDPLKFKPERFLPGFEEHNPFAFIPFSTGMRNCVGKPQAMMIMKLVLSDILRRYKILPAEGIHGIDDVKIRLDVTINLPELRVKLVTRK